jgi:prevent-host-death family protein
VKTVAIYEAKTHFSELLAAVELGEEVTITRRGNPIARLVAVHLPESLAEETTKRRALIARIRANRDAAPVEAFDVRAAIEDGRD